MKDLVSIIVPVYKVEQYLNDCVDSIFAQSYSNLEIILVDDGSPDRCPLLCDDFAEKDSRVKVIHKKNGGLSSARNAGLDVANGTYICFVDSDDFIVPTMVQNLYETIIKNENCGIVSGQIVGYKDGQMVSYRPEWFHRKCFKLSAHNFAEQVLLEKESFTVWNKIYKADLLAKIRFREGYNNEDTFFMYDLSKILVEKSMDMMIIPDVVYYYRKRADSICNTQSKPLDVDVIRNVEVMISENSDAQLNSKLKKYYIYRLILFCKRSLENELYYTRYFHKYSEKLKMFSLSECLLNCWNVKYAIYSILLLYSPSLLKKILNK